MWRAQQVLGHSSINITAIYLQFNDKDVQEAYANVPLYLLLTSKFFQSLACAVLSKRAPT